MIKFDLNKDNDSEIIGTVSPGYPVGNFTVPFSFKCPSKFYAELLLDNIRKTFDTKILAIKRDCYSKGHKDGRSKKAKREWIHTIHLKVDTDPNAK